MAWRHGLTRASWSIEVLLHVTPEQVPQNYRSNREISSISQVAERNLDYVDQQPKDVKDDGEKPSPPISLPQPPSGTNPNDADQQEDEGENESYPIAGEREYPEEKRGDDGNCPADELQNRKDCHSCRSVY